MDKLKVTIGISAYNEEANIKKLLESLAVQKGENFVLNEITLILDGCTDNTFNEASKVKNPLIKIINNKDREGKTKRINEMCTELTDDLLIILDADIYIKDISMIKKISSEFIKNSNIGLLCVDAYPITPKKLVEKAINSSVSAYRTYALAINSGKNVYTCKGVLLALSKKYAKRVLIPENVFAYDTYFYFDSLSKGFDYGFTDETFVQYSLPSTLKDHLHQNARFLAAEENIKNIFGDYVNKAFKKNQKIFFKVLFKQFLKEPVPSITVFIMNSICKIYLKFVHRDITPKWKMVLTSKGSGA